MPVSMPSSISAQAGGSAVLPELHMETGDHDSESALSELDSSTFEDFEDPVCPLCRIPVDRDLLKSFTRGKGRLDFHRRQEFCHLHKKDSAHKIWKDKHYPVIKWESMESRIGQHFGKLERILRGQRSFYGDAFSEKVKAGQNKTVKTMVKANQSLTPGYYGLKGLATMSDSIIRKFSSLLRERAVQDKLIAARGSTAFVQSVLVPELAVELVMEDMGVKQDEARTILQESISVGELVHEEEVQGVQEKLAPGPISRERSKDEVVVQD
ncbi:hypothetical protein P8C59_007342 [Phyllachora maydis]|uniref:Restriction of telomere capping protein 4 n=1 Tax=Phyllachora maydis TaxID=1825666 RepID=A0AAD9I9B9_9PEZI|nr:hypothetical protein P8C59_007342 [Phyllachora maydis]